MLKGELLDRLEIAAGQNLKEKEYWVTKLSGNPVKSIFPYDRKNKDKSKPNSDSVPFNITGDLFSKLVTLSNRSDPRLHMILAAGLTILLHK
jgi:hypothetical protein